MTLIQLVYVARRPITCAHLHDGGIMWQDIAVPLSCLRWHVFVNRLLQRSPVTQRRRQQPHPIINRVGRLQTMRCTRFPTQCEAACSLACKCAGKLRDSSCLLGCALPQGNNNIRKTSCITTATKPCHSSTWDLHMCCCMCNCTSTHKQ